MIKVKLKCKPSLLGTKFVCEADLGWNKNKYIIYKIDSATLPILFISWYVDGKLNTSAISLSQFYGCIEDKSWRVLEDDENTD